MSLDPQPLQALRRQYPALGLRQAQQLLAQTGQDVDAAAALFRQHAETTVRQRTGVDAATAAGHLQRGGYDIHAALTSIEAERYTLTERILRRHPQNPREALNLLGQALEYAYGLKRHYYGWLDPTELRRLPLAQSRFMLLHEWVSYEECETLTYDCPPEVEALLRELQLPELADCISACRQRLAELHEAYATSTWETRYDAIHRDAQLQAGEALYEQLKPTLIARLLAYVREHIDRFP